MKTLIEAVAIQITLLIIGCALTPQVWAGSFAETIGTHHGASAWTNNVRSPVNVTETIDPAKSYADNLAAFTADYQAARAYSNVVLQVFGGKEAIPVGNFLSYVAADQGAGYREHMAAKAALTADMPGVVWQIGNEINNAVLSASIHAWLGDGLAGISNDLSIIPTYAEMWLAPAAAGLGGKVMLGSVANAAGVNAWPFILALLDYQIVGTYAPGLAGRRVSEIIDYGSIHYSQQSANRQVPVDMYLLRGVPVWHTEEVGGGGAEKGFGSVLAIRALARTLSETNSKVFVWGAWIGANPADQWMPTLAAFMGADQLTPILPPVTGAGLESYAYDIGTTGKRAVFVLGGTLTGVSGSGAVYVFRAAGVEQYSVATMPSIVLDAFSVAYIELMFP